MKEKLNNCIFEKFYRRFHLARERMFLEYNTFRKIAKKAYIYVVQYELKCSELRSNLQMSLNKMLTNSILIYKSCYITKSVNHKFSKAVLRRLQTEKDVSYAIGLISR